MKDFLGAVMLTPYAVDVLQWSSTSARFPSDCR
jgi:hypothetical protein